MNRAKQVLETYRLAGVRVEVDEPAAQYRLRLENVEDPDEVFLSEAQQSGANGEIEFAVDMGHLLERTYRATLVKEASPRALEILAATQKAMDEKSELPQISAQEAREAGLPIETPLGLVHTRDPLEQVLTLPPHQALEQVRAFGESKGWSENEHEGFVQNLRELGLTTYRQALQQDLNVKRRLSDLMEQMSLISQTSKMDQTSKTSQTSQTSQPAE